MRRLGIENDQPEAKVIGPGDDIRHLRRYVRAETRRGQAPTQGQGQPRRRQTKE